MKMKKNAVTVGFVLDIYHEWMSAPSLVKIIKGLPPTLSRKRKPFSLIRYTSGPSILLNPSFLEKDNMVSSNVMRCMENPLMISDSVNS
jgi:hypothetical protein